MIFLDHESLKLRLWAHAEKVEHKTFSNLPMVYHLSYLGCPKKHGNSVTNSISSLLWISIAIPNFKSHNSIMSARVYFIKRIKDCKDVSIMSLQDEQWRRKVYSVCILQFSCFTKYNRMQSKHKQTKCAHSRRNSYRLQLSVSLY